MSEGSRALSQRHPLNSLTPKTLYKQSKILPVVLSESEASHPILGLRDEISFDKLKTGFARSARSE